jgi:hypothetical protein
MGRIWDRSAAHKRGNATKRLAAAVSFAICALCCQQVAAKDKDTEPATRAANENFAGSLPSADRADVASLLT